MKTRLLIALTASGLFASSASAQLLDDQFVSFRGGYYIGELETTSTASGAGTGSFQGQGDLAGFEASLGWGSRFMDYGVWELETVYQADTESEFATSNVNGLNLGSNFEKNTQMFGVIANIGGQYSFERFRLTGLVGLGLGARYLEIEDVSNNNAYSDTAGAFLAQARLAAEVRLDDQWGLETFYRYRYENTGDFETDVAFRQGGLPAGTGTLTTEADITNDHLIGFGVTYSFGSSKKPLAAQASSPRPIQTASYDGFPPPARDRRLTDEDLTAEDASIGAAAPSPAALRELNALKSRLAQLEDRAADIAGLSAPALSSTAPMFDDFSPPSLGPSSTARPPLGARAAAPSRQLPAIRPAAGRSPLAGPTANTARAPNSMAALANSMRELREDVTGETPPADPLFGQTQSRVF